MGVRIKRVAVRGYKTFRELDLSLENINVLIGANGSGKSNLLQLFTMMNRIAHQGLQLYVAQSGGADSLLHYGRKTTEKIWIEFMFQIDAKEFNYSAILVPTAEDTLIFEIEAIHNSPPVGIVGPHPESRLQEITDHPAASQVLETMQSLQTYHFHDTSDSAKVKQTGDIDDNLFLRPDASNLAAYLYLLRETEPAHYRMIVRTIRMVAPFFGDFVLRPSPHNPNTIRLRWQERGSGMVFGPHALSDGTLRFICLATLFLQPPDLLPPMIIVDEPELGLHPHAIALLAEMVRAAAKYSQVIVATQSVTLVNQFFPEDTLVVERVKGVSEIRRLSSEELDIWLNSYSLGDLWERNLIGGRFAR